jgi:hypothetical protein
MTCTNEVSAIATSPPRPVAHAMNSPSALWVPKTPSIGCACQFFDPLRSTSRLGKPRCPTVLLRLSYLVLTGMVTLLRLLPMSSTDKNIKILALRHQLTVLQRQTNKPGFTPTRPGVPRRPAPPCGARKRDAAS